MLSQPRLPNHRMPQQQSTHRPRSLFRCSPSRARNTLHVLTTAPHTGTLLPNTNGLTEQAPTLATPTGQLYCAAHGMANTCQAYVQIHWSPGKLHGTRKKSCSLRAHRAGRKRALDIVRACPQAGAPPMCGSHQANVQPTSRRSSPDSRHKKGQRGRLPSTAVPLSSHHAGVGGL